MTRPGTGRGQVRACLLTAALALAGTVACGDSAGGGGDARLDAAISTELGDIVGTMDGAADALPEVMDVAPDTGPPDIVWPDIVPEEGEFLWPCDEDDDCNSGACVESPDGKVCTITCEATCPAQWWKCKQNLASSSGVIYHCLPIHPTLCYPCRDSSDCVTVHDSTPHACIPGGDQGSFCGGLCDKESCPAGTYCTTVADVNGVPSKQCVPLEGTCACPPRASQLGLSTDCSVTNEFGTCGGVRECDGSGLTDCTADTPAEDLCDGLDNDCDDDVDEAFVSEACSNGNDFGSCDGVTVCEGVDQVTCTAVEAAEESCDGADNDCDGETDEEDAIGCSERYLDADSDTFGTGDPRCLCADEGSWTATVAGDCDDDDSKIRPDATEGCNGYDDDCDGVTDDADSTGCIEFHKDEDEDGFGDPVETSCLCLPATPYTTTDATDCDDLEPAVSPAASEVCNDGVDDDCDGSTDEEGAGGCQLLFADGDGDQFGDPATFACLCTPEAPYLVTAGGDCDDTEAAINPGLVESCDTIDNDCDGLTDESGAEGCEVYYLDDDQDDYGIAGDSQCLCAPEAPYSATVFGDCNDASADSYPGADELCNTIDDDCDDVVDEVGSTGCETYYKDNDLDGFGVPGDELCLCSPAIPYVSTDPTDCDDSNPFIYPQATESCNGLDDDCNSVTDDGVVGSCTDFYVDADGDGWGGGESTCLCSPEGSYTAVKTGDCDDADKTVYPQAQEFCNGVDDDCDADIDEQDALGCMLYFKDADADAFGIATDSRCLCAPDPVEAYTATVPGDCDDSDDQVLLGAVEVCDLVDNDCDGVTDEAGAGGCSDYLRDTDGDDFGVASDTQCLCAPGAVYRATVGGDCDDADELVNPGMTEVCNGYDDDCNGVADDPGIDGCSIYYMDLDGDTWGNQEESGCFCGPVGTFTATQVHDCDDTVGSTNPAATEQCNGKDDDCNASVDEQGSVGCVDFMIDADADSFGVSGDTQCLCEATGDYNSLIGGDCLDSDAAVFPGAAEACNTLDDDCDGATDEMGAAGCALYYLDADDDAYGVSGDTQCLCAPTDPYDAAAAGDCDDDAVTGPTVNPGGSEACNGVDDDCNGIIDDPGTTGCSVYYRDADGDGYGNSADSQCLCAAKGTYTAEVGGDCDDTLGSTNPGATESCNGVDDDCDGSVDEQGAAGCVDFLRDADGDGFGQSGVSECHCVPTGDFDTLLGGDCDDDVATGANVYPGALESCNTVDDDCDGATDETGSSGCTTYYRDDDDDTFGLSSDSQCLCAASGPYDAPAGGDCNDDAATGAAVYPGQAEACNAVDDDCNGLVDDPGATGCSTYYLDADGDGYGDSAQSQCLCAASGLYSTLVGGDCDDSLGSTNPGATEQCNGVDDNCDASVDEVGSVGCVDFLKDEDGDTFGVTGDAQCLCSAGPVYRAVLGGDCDDTAATGAAVFPGAVEACNGVDDDCDSSVDEAGSSGCTTYYRDDDDDTYGVAGDTQCSCAAADPYDATQAGDCDDTLPGGAAVNPAAGEVCNLVDDDCDGVVDQAGTPDCTDYFLDADGDSWGVAGDSQCLCAPAGLYTATQTDDCDDAVGTTNPGAPETCNSVDDDCDSVVDEIGAAGCSDFLKDEDGDTFGVTGDSQCLCAAGPVYRATLGGDCDDTLATGAAVFPGAVESCNGVDDNCDSVVDEEDAAGCTDYLRDDDDDTFGVTGDSRCLCAASDPYDASAGGDCDDTVASGTLVFPGQTESCNTIDDDCNGVVDDAGATGCTVYYRDADGDTYGDGAQSACLCEVAGLFTTTDASDCDDTLGSVNPAATEQCNGIDDDCDASADEAGSVGCFAFLADADGDTFGVDGDTQCLCAAGAVYGATLGGDCDDTPVSGATIYPGAAEACNAVDDDCDTVIDEEGASGCTTYYRDNDDDTFGQTGDTRCLCAASDPYDALAGGDCDDTLATGTLVYPGQTESCNSVDDDCNGLIDDPGTPGCTVYYRDGDGDGYGDAGQSQCLCAATGLFNTTDSSDCDDTLASVNTAATESCNGFDDNCDSVVDEVGAVGCFDFLRDVDGDSFGVTGDTQCRCTADATYRATLGGDCDDSTIAVNPEAVEACNTVDDDCDTLVDEAGATGCTDYFKDEDGDTYGVSADSSCLCAASAPYDVLIGGDCDDTPVTGVPYNPGATETCNGVDDDCDGFADEEGAGGCTVYYRDDDGDSWGDLADSKCLCAGLGAYTALVQASTDCDNSNPLVNPGLSEACNGYDDNCVSGIDEAGATGCTTYWRDDDDDTFGVTGDTQCLCAATDPYDATQGNDCNDAVAVINPSQSEICDALDNQCDGVVDEGCGLPNVGWPTHMYDQRRTGHTMQYDTPNSPSLRWTTMLVPGWDIESSPVIYGTSQGGDVVVSAGNQVFRLDVTSGSTAAWTPYTLPANVNNFAGPTLRVGDTIVASGGTWLVMLRPDLTEIWATDLGSIIVSTPIVDPEGDIYVVSAAALHRVGPDGVELWSEAIVNDTNTPSHPAIGINGRIYFAASAHQVYAYDPDAAAGSREVWVSQPWLPAPEPTVPVYASVAISELGFIYQAFEQDIYALRIADGTVQYSNATPWTFRSGIAIHNTGYQCCNPEEYFWLTPQGNLDLRRFTVDLVNDDQSAQEVNTNTGAMAATIVFDRDGDIVTGSDEGRIFSFTQGGADRWNYGGGGLPDMDGPAALGAGIIVIADDNGNVRCLEE